MRLEKKAWVIHKRSEHKETEKGETGEEQCQVHAYDFLCHQRDYSQRIRLGSRNSQFRILL
jgi:hypothetical protein